MTSSDIDITAISGQLRAAGIPTEIHGGGGVFVLRIGAQRPHHRDPHDQRAQLAAGPAHWDNAGQRFAATRADFCIGPDNGTEGDDLADFHVFPDTTTEQEITEHILAALADACPLCGKPSNGQPCHACHRFVFPPAAEPGKRSSHRSA